MSNIKELVNEILNSGLKPETQVALLEGFDNQKDVEVVLQDELAKKHFRSLMEKNLLTGNDLITFPSQPNDYLVEKFLWKGSVMFLVGAEKACKSIFITQMLMAMTAGKPFLGTFDIPRPLKVLYIQAEGNLGETKERFINSTKKDGIVWNPDNWRHYYPAALALDTEEDFIDLTSRLDRDKFVPDVICTDPLYMSMQGDLIDNKAARAFCRNLRRLNEKYDSSVIVVHHEHRAKEDKYHNKIEEGDNAIFGSSMWKNFASHVLRISIVNDRGNPISPEKEDDCNIKYRKIACATQRNDNVIRRVMLELNQSPLMFKVIDQHINTATEEAVYNCIANSKAISACDVAKTTGINQQTVYSCYQRLVEKNKIKIHSKTSKKTLYCVDEGELFDGKL